MINYIIIHEYTYSTIYLFQFYHHNHYFHFFDYYLIDQNNLIILKEYLLGKKLDSKTVIEAAKVLHSEISPISDVRGAADYKRLLAQQLFFAHFIELFPNQIKLDKLIAE